MEYKKLLLTLIVGIFLVGLVASQEDPTFQFNKQFDLKRGCSNNGFFCGSDFVCNVTLLYPDGTLLKDNFVMTDSTSYRNITITATENDQLGFMKAIESCNNGTVGGFEAFDVAITADGKKFQVFPTQLVIVILGFVLIATGFMTERLSLFKQMGSILLMVMGVITLYPGYSFINYTTLLGKALGFILVGIGGYFLIEGSFSREEQEKTFHQPQEEEEDDD